MREIDICRKVGNYNIPDVTPLKIGRDTSNQCDPGNIFLYLTFGIYFVRESLFLSGRSRNLKADVCGK